MTCPECESPFLCPELCRTQLHPRGQAEPYKPQQIRTETCVVCNESYTLIHKYGADAERLTCGRACTMRLKARRAREAAERAR